LLECKNFEYDLCSSTPDWLKHAQALMVDAVGIEEVNALTGKLWCLASKVADDSDLFMKDPDAIAFADAFNQALEFGKHGREIRLPHHLHSKVPVRFQKYLSLV